jgi:hypothetical protein
MATFGERLSSVLGTNAGYDPSLRRSIQNAALFEAKRIIDHMEAQRAADDSLEHLRAFQRKYVFWELAKQVLDTTHLQPEERAQVLWRKMTTKEPLGPETAWKRVRTIEKELESLADAIRPLLQAGGRSEEQAIDEYIARAFVSSPYLYTRQNTLLLVPSMHVANYCKSILSTTSNYINRRLPTRPAIVLRLACGDTLTTIVSSAMSCTLRMHAWIPTCHQPLLLVMWTFQGNVQDIVLLLLLLLLTKMSLRIWKPLFRKMSRQVWKNVVLS